MKLIMKKILIITVMFVLVFCVSKERVFAVGEGVMTLEEGADFNNQTKYEKQIEREKEEEMKKFFQNRQNFLTTKNVKAVKNKYTGWFNLGIPVYKQNTTYYCGPASVQMVVKYVSGKLRKQSFYAKKLGTKKAGTNINRISRVLNSYTKRKFTCSYVGSKHEFKKRVIWDTLIFCPMVLNIRVRSHDGWKYRTDGHYIPTAGIYLKNNNLTKIRVADSHPRKYGYHSHSLKNIYTVVKQSNTEKIVW